MQGTQLLRVRCYIYESLVGQCEYTVQPQGSFLLHVIDIYSRGCIDIDIHK